jgi:DMSO/TMAO reductase YedYZ molybdopterin-dependent catalytic subunit
MSRFILNRRGLIAGGATAAGGFMLAGCDMLNENATVQSAFDQTQKLTYHSQRLIGRNALAPEFTAADISPIFKANGTIEPDTDDYMRIRDANFTNWALKIDGLVARPLSLTLDDIRKLPARTQITRHDCVEGWSAIGKWSGPQLGGLLKAAGPLPNARFAVFHCADNLGNEPNKGGDQSAGRYYESVDMIDAFHPQSILAHSLNDAPLTVPHGAPLRLRVERQLGYKQAKYLMRIELVDSFARFSRGKGGFWPDRGYEWYAGI